MSKSQSKSTSKDEVLSFREIGKRSYALIGEAERTINWTLRQYIHRKFPNVPITRIVIFGKVTALAVSTGIAYHTLRGSENT